MSGDGIICKGEMKGELKEGRRIRVRWFRGVYSKHFKKMVINDK